MSRACLGAMFVFVYQWLKKTGFGCHFVGKSRNDSAYDLESGGGADPAELAQLRNEVAMLRSKNAELEKRVLNQQKEIIVFFVLLFVALVFVVIALFTDLIRSG